MFYFVCLGGIVAMLVVGRLVQRLFDVLPLVADDLTVAVERWWQERRVGQSYRLQRRHDGIGHHP